ncbi:MAG: type II toxin-antitoxin system HipA family toxin [Gammaproteobacteria bacterium]|nr:type II toxin-antitoxin system HipA family toxin [Gammaproteobacteria bacterium]
MLKKVDLVNVYYSPSNERIPVGRLAIKDQQVYFEYASTFLQLGLELSPFKLPLKLGVLRCADRCFDGLFGIFNDSLPDGWGRLLLDRKLMKLGIQARELTVLDRLCYVGSRGMGALIYEPATEDPFSIAWHDLDALADECVQFQEDDDQFVDELLLLNGSSGGARPKILVNRAQEPMMDSSAQHNDWIIKFRAALDPKDIGSIEYGYHLMAIAAGLDVPQAKLFASKKCSGYFGVKRFDRLGATRVHMHTVSGLLHADHRLPSLDYEMLMKATSWLTKDVRECEKQFRQTVFNILAHNRDDHAKNFSFLMDDQGTWQVSPAYDLVFSSGPAAEHSTSIMGEGRNPKLTHIMKLADVGSIKKEKALEIIEQVRDAIARWNEFAKDANVTAQSTNKISNVLNNMADIMDPENCTSE